MYQSTTYVLAKLVSFFKKRKIEHAQILRVLQGLRTPGSDFMFSNDTVTYAQSKAQEQLSNIHK